MSLESDSVERHERVLHVYLLGTVEFEDVLRLQRRLVYDIAGDRTMAALVICEHPPVITVGRDGSREHIRFERDELLARGWPVRWVNRGGGCVLHAPGQLAIYPIIALDEQQIDLRTYLARLHATTIEVLMGFDLVSRTRPDRAGVWIRDRLVAHVGVAVRDWIAYFGIALNVNPDLAPFRRVLSAGAGEPPMTSMEGQRRSQVRISSVRQKLVDVFARQFAIDRVALFHTHPLLSPTVAGHALAARRA